MRLAISVIVCMVFIAFASAQTPCINPGLCPNDLSNLLRTPCSDATTSCCAKSFLLGLRQNSLVFIDPNNAALGESFFIVGLVDNDESIIGMDIRPLNGLLYALSDFGRLYTITIDPFSNLAQASLVAQTSLVINPDLKYAFCINPQADRIRVIATDDSNFRINPDNGQVFNDSSITLDTAPGVSVAISACSYTNNVPNASSTQLYGVSSDLTRLVTVVPPNNPNAGVFTLVDPNNLVAGVNVDDSIGFKIFTTPAAETSFVVLAPDDTTQSPQLNTINLDTGSTTPVGNLPFALDSLTVSPVAVCYCPFPSRSLTVIFNPNDGSLVCAA